MKNLSKPILFLALLLLAGACASAAKTPKTKPLQPHIDDYNNMIRWKQPAKAAPHVHPSASAAYKSWSKEMVDKYDFQDWSLETVTYETALTATVVIERIGYEIPKYIEKTIPAIQLWTYDENLGWRIRSGF